VFGRSFFCTRLAVYFSAVHSDFIVCVGEICLIFKFLLKFRNVSKHSDGRSSFASLILKYQNRRPHSVGGFPLLKRNET